MLLPHQTEQFSVSPSVTFAELSLERWTAITLADTFGRWLPFTLGHSSAGGLKILLQKVFIKGS
jgi:hypothetical protein